ncbi:MAG TPA: magnesium protoporphyrin IX methyltransferase [Burkholderiaceae bacterium]|nr:magnesium protoporphyrin IX methyltransferase [Burkholderiaceae bacterium]
MSAIANPSYRQRRAQVESYFDRTAADAWARLTSEAPVSGIRATVRAGRNEMRACLLDWLPADLAGRRILDAGCGTGLLAFEAARRGAEVLAVDLSPTLVELARQRLPQDIDPARIRFEVGDMHDPAWGSFDHVVAMDSLIHYRASDATRVLEALAPRTRESIVFTFAPRTRLLATMHAVGKLFPRADRSPAIEPVAPHDLVARLRRAPGLVSWTTARTQRVARGFYISQALELRHGH